LFSGLIEEGRVLTEKEGTAGAKLLHEFSTKMKSKVSNVMKSFAHPFFNPKDPFRTGHDDEIYSSRMYAVAEAAFRHCFHGKSTYLYWCIDKKTATRVKVTQPIGLGVDG
jgi:hypothetical protein